MLVTRGSPWTVGVTLSYSGRVRLLTHSGKQRVNGFRLPHADASTLNRPSHPGISPWRARLTRRSIPTSLPTATITALLPHTCPLPLMSG